MTDSRIDRSIVVGVDGSPSALHATSWAAAEAARRNLPLRLVHGVFVPYWSGGVGSLEILLETADEEGRRVLDEAETQVTKEFPDVTVTGLLRRGDPNQVLIDESTTAGLVVLGSRGLGGITATIVGSTAIALAAHGHSPVAVIREAIPAGGPVVVGIDGSPASEAAVAIAFEEASLRGVDLIAAHTWTDYSTDIAYAYARANQLLDWRLIETEQTEVLSERLAGWQEPYPDVVVHRQVARDRPVRHLLAVAERREAQLLVVGSRGRGGFTGMLLGSTSRALTHHAPCPLLVARPQG